MRWSAILVLILLCNLNANVAIAGDICSADKRVMAACYDIHGRLRVYANMRPYLWPTGTKRLLGVASKSDASDTDYFMQNNLARTLNLNTDIFVDFHVCPFTPEKTGELQIVCIDSASH